MLARNNKVHNAVNGTEKRNQQLLSDIIKAVLSGE